MKPGDLMILRTPSRDSMSLGIPCYHVPEERSPAHNKNEFKQYIPANQVVIVLSIVPNKQRIEVITGTHGVGWIMKMYMNSF